jgi:hypothetical protein
VFSAFGYVLDGKARRLDGVVKCPKRREHECILLMPYMMNGIKITVY